jgi:hypothetical protein
MTTDRSGRLGRRGGLTLLALAAGVVGLILVIVALQAQRSAPEPPRSVGRIDPPSTASPSAGSPSASPARQSVATPLGASRPVSIRIPAFGVSSKVFPIGLADDGTLAVPQPGPRLNQAAWFKNSPTPGQPGPAIIEGHVDSEQGPSVFFRLGDIRPGDRILVDRADGAHLVFRVDAVRDFMKKSFPTQLVYGAKDLSIPALRLITCSNFDPSIRHHVGNEVVFAHRTRATGQPSKH